MQLPRTLEDYEILETQMRGLSQREWMHLARELCRSDLYFLLRYVLSTREWLSPTDPDKSIWDHPWLLARCREVQFDSAGVLDVWARGHFKSTIKTFGWAIQCLLRNPNETVGIFSVTKGVADEFVTQVRREFEENELLKSLFPDILYWSPRKEADRWTIDKGFVIKRSLNLKDASLRGFGLLDSTFTGHRLSKGIYDDAVNESNVTTPEMIARTTKQWELSLGTGMPGAMQTMIGTFYAYGDTYHDVAEKGFRLRLWPCYEVLKEESEFDGGTGLPIRLEVDTDKPILFPQEYLDTVERRMGPTTFAIQMLCNPRASTEVGFQPEWVKRYSDDPQRVWRITAPVTYILVDPANAKKKHSSRTAMWVVGLGKDGNYYVLDGVWDRMNLSERVSSLFGLVHKWRPVEVRYERYSFQSDIPHIEHIMNERGFRFQITEVAGVAAKDDRISRLIPLFKEGKIYLPLNLSYRQTDGEVIDLAKEFIRNEYLQFPNTTYKDMLDALSRICEPDMTLAWPRPNDYFIRSNDSWGRDLYAEPTPDSKSWMSV